MKIIKIMTVITSDEFNGQPMTLDEKHWDTVRRGMLNEKPFEVRVQGGNTVILNPRNIVEAWLQES